MVLGYISCSPRQTRGLGASAETGTQCRLPDGMVNATQDSPSDRREGQPVQLTGIVEKDETYVGGVKGAENEGVEQKKRRFKWHYYRLTTKGIVKIEKHNDVSAVSIGDFAVRHIKAGAVVRSDEYRSYPKAFAGQPYIHEPVVNVRGNGKISSILNGSIVWWGMRKHSYLAHITILVKSICRPS